MLPELIEVLTAVAEKHDAQAIATLLVEKRLAACVQITSPIESSYWWNDRIETAREWQVIAKTLGSLYGAVEEAIREMHPYDEPEILALPVLAASPGYRKWVFDQLALPEKQVAAPALTPRVREAERPADDLPPLLLPGMLDVPPLGDPPAAEAAATKPSRKRTRKNP
jgi:periplasmic divalent cation tolerance protein